MKKRFASLIAVLIAVLTFGTTCLALDTDDHVYEPTEAIDFCVYNTWGTKSIDVNKATIENMRMIVKVSDFSGDPVTVKLYNRESVTWGYWVSEPQTIDKDGTYYFDIDIVALGGEAYPAENLCTIYLKDVRCCTADEDAEGEGLTESGISAHIELDSIKFNTSLDPIVVEPEQTEAVEAAPAEEADIAPAENKKEKKDKKDNTVVIVIVIVAVVIACAAVVLALSKRKKK